MQQLQSGNISTKLNCFSEKKPKLIDFSQIGTFPINQKLLSILAGPIEKSLHIDKINSLYEVSAKEGPSSSFFKNVLETMGVSYDISFDDIEKIPNKGALILVANHPFGAIEGMILADLLLRVRQDTKILGNYLLHHIPEIREKIIPVDPFGHPNSPKANIKGLKHAIRWLRNGGSLVSFPAGEVSHFQFPKFRITDPKWADHMAALIRLGNAGTVPIYIPGRNSLLFQLLGLIHPRLRTMLLPRELLKKQKKRVKLYVGKPISWKKLSSFDTDRERVDFLRLNTYFLKNRIQKRRFGLLPAPVKRPITVHRIIPSAPKERLKKEIERLPKNCMLIEKEGLAVYLTQSNEIPHLLNEIGRLRELTFRQVHEGTGKAVDLDRFDAYYQHLFLWDRRNSQLIGAYRLGPVDRIIKKYGVQGLYSSTLFRFRAKFIERLGAAVEIGRSFIRCEYQKKYSSLLLLWQGIGTFISRNPKYRILFGPVSISRDYHSVSKNLLIRFLKENNTDSELSRFVKPRHPYRLKRVSGIDGKSISKMLKDIDDVSILISEIEEDGKTVPVLLRHYLKLNADLISFNVDHSFSKVIDGLIRVNLETTEPRLLKRFMGPEGFKKFSHYNASSTVRPTRGQQQ
jgi:putative hemolysin